MPRRKSKRSAWGALTQVDATTWRIRYWASGPDGYKRRSKTLRFALALACATCVYLRLFVQVVRGVRPDAPIRDALGTQKGPPPAMGRGA